MQIPFLQRWLNSSRYQGQSRRPTQDVDEVLSLRRLEDRLVLDGAFTVGAGILTLDALDSTTLTITENNAGSRYEFTLSGGTTDVWSGSSSDANVNGSTVAVRKSAFSTLVINDNLGNGISVVFDESFARNAVTMTGVGNISQSAGTSVNVTTLSITTELDTNTVVLDRSGNDFGTMSVNSGIFTMRDQNGLVLSSSDASALSVVAGGNVTQQNDAIISIDGDMSVTTSSGIITLADDSGSDGGTDELTVGGTGTFTATGNIRIGIDTLGDNSTATADFGTLQLASSAGSITVAEDSSTELGSSSSSTSMTIDSLGDITQVDDAVITVGTNGTFRTSNGAIVLANDPNGNSADILSISGIALFDATSDIRVGVDGAGAASSATTNFGSLSVSSVNALTDTVITIHEDSATILNDIQAETLAISSNGGISQSGVGDVTVESAASFMVTDATAQSVILDVGTNDLSDDITVNGLVANLQLTSVNTSQPSLALTGGAASPSGNATLIFAQSSFVLPALNVGGNLNVTANGDVTQGQDASVSVSGNASITSSTGKIVVADDPLAAGGDNSFTVSTGSASFTAETEIRIGVDVGGNASDANTAFGSLALTTLGASANAIVHEDSDTSLASSSIVGDITLSSTGNITQVDDAVIAISRNADISTSGGSIVLADDVNDNDIDALTVAGVATFAATSTIRIGIDSSDVDSGANVTFAALGVTTQNSADASVIVDGGISFVDSSIAGSLLAEATGSIALQDDNSLTVGDNAALISTAAVTLGNDTGDTVSVVGQLRVSAGDTIRLGAATDGTDAGATASFGSLAIDTTSGGATIAEDGNTVLDSSSITGTIRLRSSGTIDDSSDAMIAVTGDAIFIASGDIVLADDPGDDGNGDSFVVAGSADFTSANDVRIGARVDDLASQATAQFGSVSISGSGVIVHHDADIVIDSLSANVVVVSALGSITDSGIGDVVVATQSSWKVTAPDATDIILDSANNDLADSMFVAGKVNDLHLLSGSSGAAILSLSGVDGGDFSSVTLDFANASLQLDTMHVANDLHVDTRHEITQAEDIVITVGGNATFDSAEGTITLAQDSSSTVTDQLIVTGSATFVATDDVLVGVTPGGVNTSAIVQFGTLILNVTDGTNSTVTRIHESDGTQLASVDVDTLFLSSAGTIGQVAGDIQAAVATTFDITGPAANVLLGTTSNDLSTNITVTGTVNNLTLTSVNNTKPTLSLPDSSIIPFGDVSLAFSSADFDIPNLHVGGDLTINAGGNIRQLNDTTVDVAGNMTVATSSGQVVLGEDSDNQNDDVLHVTGRLAASSTGNILVGATLGGVGTGANVQLGSIAATTSGGSVSVFEDNDMSVGPMDVTGVLRLGSSANILTFADSTVNVTGDAVVATTAGSIVLADDALNNNVETWVVGGNAQFQATGDIRVGATALGVDTGATVQFGTLNVATIAGVTAISEDNSTTIAGLVSDGLFLRSAGSITNTADAIVTITGNAIVDAAAGTITLAEDSDNDGINSFTVTGTTSLIATGDIRVGVDGAGINSLATTNFGQLSINSVNAVTPTTSLVHEDASMTLGAVSADTLTLTASGSITQVSGVLDINSALVIGSTAASSDILLGDTGNDLSTSISVIQQVRDLTLVSGNSNAATIDVTGVTAEDIVLSFANAPLVLDSIATTGSLTVTAEGNVTDTADAQLQIATTATFTSTAGAITLVDDTGVGGLGHLTVGTIATFHAAGDIRVGVISDGTASTRTTTFGSLVLDTPGDVYIREDNSTMLDAVDVDALTLSSHGNIEQSSTPIQIATSLTLETTSSGSSIILAEPTLNNLLSGDITVSGPVGILQLQSKTGPMTTVDTSGITGNVLASANLNFTNSSVVLTSILMPGSLVVFATGGISDVDGAAMQIGGNVTYASSGGTIILADDPGAVAGDALTVGAEATFDATAVRVGVTAGGADSAANTSFGRLSVAAHLGSAVIRSDVATVLEDIDVGNFSLLSGGTVGQSAGFAVDIQNSLTLTGSSSAADLALTTATNELSSSITLAGSWNNVHLVSQRVLATTVGGPTFAATGNVDLDFVGSVTLGSLDVAGDLNVTTEGLIADSDGTVIDVGGEAIFDAGADASDTITLGDDPNGTGSDRVTVVGVARFVAGGNVRIGVTSGGANSNADTQFGAIAIVAAGASATVYEDGVATLSEVNVDSLILSAATGIDQDAIGVSVNSALNLTVNSIGSDILLAEGTNHLSTDISVAGNARDVTLASMDVGTPTIDMAGVTAGQLQNVILSFAEASINLEDMDVGGDLTVVAKFDIADVEDAVVQVSGNATFTSTQGSIALGDDADLDDVGAITVVQAATFTAFNDIHLGFASSDLTDVNATFGSLSLTTTGVTSVVVVHEDDDMILSGVSARDVALSADGNVGQDSNGITISDRLTVSLRQSGHNIDLDEATNDLSASVSVAGDVNDLKLASINSAASALDTTGIIGTNFNDVTLNFSQTSIALDTMTVGGDLIVTARNDVTTLANSQIAVSGNATITSTNADVILADDAGLDGGEVFTVTGSATLTAGGSLRVGVSAAGAVNDATVQLGTVNLAVGDAARIGEDASTQLGSVVVDSLLLFSDGDVTQTASGVTAITAVEINVLGASRNITLDQANDLSPSVKIVGDVNNLSLTSEQLSPTALVMPGVFSGDVTLNFTQSSVVLASLNVGGALSVQGSGNISDTAGSHILAGNGATFISNAGTIILADNALDQLSIVGDASFQAAGMILVGAEVSGVDSGAGVTASGAVLFDTAAAAVLNEDDAVSVGVVDVGTLVLVGDSSIAQHAVDTITVANSTTIAMDVPGTITLTNANDLSPTVVLQGVYDSVDIVTMHSGLTTLEGDLANALVRLKVTSEDDLAFNLAAISGNLELTSNAGALSDLNGTTLHVLGDAIFNASTSIVLADNGTPSNTDQLIVDGAVRFESGGATRVGVTASGNDSSATTQFGDISVVALGGTTVISEDASIALDAVSATGLTLITPDSIGNAASGTGVIDIASSLDIRLLGAIGNVQLAGDDLSNSVTISGMSTGIALTSGNSGLTSLTTDGLDTTGSFAVTVDGALALTSNNVTGSLAVIAGGDISTVDDSQIGVTANASFTSTTGNIVLADDVGLDGIDSLMVLGQSTFNAGGSIAVGQVAGGGASAANVDLAQVSFTTLTGSAALYEDAEIAIDAANVDSLLLWSTVGINQVGAGAIDVGTSLSLQVSGATGDIILANPLNDLSGSIALAGSVRDLHLSSQHIGATSFVAGTISTTGNALLDFEDSLDLPSLDVGGQLHVTSNGDIRNIADAQIGVTGNAFFTSIGGVITLADDVNGFGIEELIVVGVASFSAGGDVRVGADGGGSPSDAATQFGQIAVSSSANIFVHEDDDMSLLGISGNTVQVSSDGSITQTPATNLNVANALIVTLQAAGSDIILSESSNDLSGSISVFGNARNIYFASQHIGPTTFGAGALTATGNVTLDFSSDIALPSVAAQGTLTVSSAGDITTLDDAVVNIMQDAILDAGGLVNVASDADGDGVDQFVVAGLFSVTGTGDIRVGVDGAGNDVAAFTNFGSLSIVAPGQSAIVREDDSTLLRDINVASLRLSSDGDVEQVAGTTINISSDLTLELTNAVGDVLLNDASNDLSGSIDLIGTLHDLDLSSLHAGPTLFGGGSLVTNGNATFTFTNSLSLPNLDILGSLVVNSSGAVSTKDDAQISVQLDAQITGNSGIVIADDADGDSVDSFAVGGLAHFISNGNIFVGSDGVTASSANVQVNRATFATNTGDVVLRSDDAITLVGDNTANAVEIVTDLSIDNEEGMTLVVTGDANFTAGTSIQLLDDADLAGGESLRVDGVAVFVAPNGIDLGVHVGDGSAADSDLILNQLRFASSAGVRAFADTALTLIGDSAADTLALASTVAIADQPATTLNVAGATTLWAPTVVLGDATSARFAFGTLAVAGASQATSVTVFEADDTTITGIDAQTLLLGSRGNIQQGTVSPSHAVTSTNATFNLQVAGSDISLLNPANDMANLSIIGDGGNVAIFNNATTVDLSLLTAGFADVELHFVNSAINLPSFTLTGALTLESGGAITDDVGATINVGGVLSIDSNGADVTLGDNGAVLQFGGLQFVDIGNLDLTAVGNITIAGSSSASSATIIAAGSLSDAEDVAIVIAGSADFQATDITLADDGNGNGALGGGDRLDVGGLAKFSAAANQHIWVGVVASGGSPVVASDADVLLGQLTFNAIGGDVRVAVDGNVALDGANDTDDLTLIATGDITQVAATSLKATSLASFRGNSIVLDQDNNLAATTFNSANHVQILQNNAVLLQGVNLAGSLDLQGTTIVSTSADVNVVGLAEFSANSIQVAGPFDSGSLRFNSSGTVAIADVNDIILAGVSGAASTQLSAGGSISDSDNAAVVIAGDASFTASGAIQLVDDPTNNGGSAGDKLTVEGGALFVAGNGQDIDVGVRVGGANDGDASNGRTVFGSLSFQSPAGRVRIHEDNGIVLEGNNIAGQLELSSTAGIVDQTGHNLNVSGAAVLSAVSATIGQHAGSSINFGSLSLDGGSFAINESSATELRDINVTELTLQSAGSITQTSSASVTGTTDLTTSDPAADIMLTQSGNQFDGLIAIAGTVRDVFVRNDSSNAAVSFGATGIRDVQLVFINGGIDFEQLEATGNLTVQAGGVVRSAAGATLVIGGTTVIDAGTHDVLLGTFSDDDVRFGAIRFTSSGSVELHENDGTNLTGNNLAANLTIESSGGVFDNAGAMLHVTGSAVFTGATITIDNSSSVANAFTTGSLEFHSPGNVKLVHSTATVLAGPNSGGNVNLTSGGDVTTIDDASLVVAGDATITAAGTIVLADDSNQDSPDSSSDQFSIDGLATLVSTAGGDIIVGLQDGIIAAAASNATWHAGMITFATTGDVAIADDSLLKITGANSCDNLRLIAVDGVEDDAATMTMVSGLVDVSAAHVNLGNGAAVLSLSELTANGTLVSIEADSSVTLVGDSSLHTFVLASSSTIDNANNAALRVVSRATLIADTVDLGTASGDQIQLRAVEFNTVGATELVVIGTIDLAGTSSAGQLSVQTNGNITDSGILAVSGGTRLATVSNAVRSIVLDSSGHVLGDLDVHNFAADGVTLNDGTIQVVEQDAIAIQSVGNLGSVTMVSAGDISGTVAGVSGVTGSQVTLSAATGIGNLSGIGALGLNADSISATSAAGDIAIVNQDTVAGGDVNVVELATSTGEITFEQQGGHRILLDDARTGNGNIALVNDNAAVDILRAQAVGGSGGPQGDLDVHVTGGPADVLIGTLIATGTVTIDGADLIENRLLGSTGVAITAGAVDLSAQGGIGSIDAIGLATGSIRAVTGAGSVGLTNDASTLSTAVSANVQTTTGNIQLNQKGVAGLDVQLARTIDGDIEITNDDGDLNVDILVAGTTTTGDGNVVITTASAGNVAVNRVVSRGDTTIINSAGVISGIVGGIDDVAADVVANSVVLSAADGIANLDLEVVDFEATALTGDVELEIGAMAGPVSATHVVTGNGDLSIAQTGGESLLVQSATIHGNATISNDGSVQVATAQIGGVGSGDGSVVISATGTGANIEIDSLDATNDRVQLIASGDIGEFNADAAPDIVTGQLIVQSSNVGSVSTPLQTAVQEFAATVTGGVVRVENAGDLTIGLTTGEGISVLGGTSDVAITADALLVKQAVTHAGDGDIQLTSTVGDVGVFGAVAVSHGGAVVRIDSAGDIVVDNGGSIATPTGGIGQFPTPLVVEATDFGGVTVDSDGFAQLEISILDLFGSNFEIAIDWGDGIEVYPPLNNSGSSGNNTGPPFDGGTTSHNFVHQYLTNPNQADSSAAIPVTVTITYDFRGVGVANGIQLSNSQNAVVSTTQTIDLQPPVNGFGAPIPLRSPERPDITSATQVVAPPPREVTLPNVIQGGAVIPSSGGGAVSAPEKQLVLRVVSPTGEEGDDIPIPDQDATDLPLLFQRLPDNRYRVYLINEDGSELLIYDVAVREGRQTSPNDASDEQPDRPPLQITADADDAEVDRMMWERLGAGRDPSSVIDDTHAVDVTAVGAVDGVPDGVQVRARWGASDGENDARIAQDIDAGTMLWPLAGGASVAALYYLSRYYRQQNEHEDEGNDGGGLLSRVARRARIARGA